MSNEANDGYEYLVTDDMLDIYRVVGGTDASIRVQTTSGVTFLVDARRMTRRGDKWGPTFRLATDEEIALVKLNLYDTRVRSRALKANSYSGRPHEWFVRLRALLDEQRRDDHGVKP